MRVLGDYCGTRYGVRLHLAADTRMCRECAAVVEQALNPGVERERHTSLPPAVDAHAAAVARDLRRLISLIHQAMTTPPDRKDHAA